MKSFGYVEFGPYLVNFIISVHLLRDSGAHLLGDSGADLLGNSVADLLGNSSAHLLGDAVAHLLGDGIAHLQQIKTKTIKTNVQQLETIANFTCLETVLHTSLGTALHTYNE